MQVVAEEKANVLRTTTGFFLEICREIGAEYPEVELDDFHSMR